MQRHTRLAWSATGLALAGLALAGGVRASGAGSQAEDDLAVVKKAVAGAERVQEPRADDATVRSEQEAPPPRVREAGKEPTWLKVRVIEKGSKRSRVTVSLPLALVRAMGDGWPEIRFRCGDHRERCAVRVSEILAALEAGQELVEVDEEDAHVLVWVE